MTFWRALVFFILVASGLFGGGVLSTRAVTAAPLRAPSAAEDAATQSRALAEGYNLILDHYVHPLDTSALLTAGWDELTHESDGGKAAGPGPVPQFSGDRASDLETLRGALTTYLGRQNSSPDGFIAAHALIR